MLRSAIGLATEGFAVHWLHPRSKRPRGKDWSTKPVASPEKLERTYRDGYNVGIRLGEPSIVCGYYAHVLDIDIRDPDFEDEALEALDRLLGTRWEKFPQVKSGSGGPSFHVYFFTDDHFSSKKLAHSKAKFKTTGEDGKVHTHFAWEIELFGTGKQVACPPSIHPDTGKPYRWLREVDFDELDSGHGPIIPADEVESWGGARDEDESERRSTRKDSSSSSLSDIHRKRPLGLTVDEVREHLSYLDFDEYCFDYAGWLTVGMALHHEFEGDEEGLDEWHRFSKKADNYDPDVLDEKWKSFGRDKRRRPVRFATLIQAGAHNRFEREFSGADSAEDMDKETDDANDTKWLRRLALTEKGLPKSTVSNIKLIIENDPRLIGTIGFNLFTNKDVIRKRPGRKITKSDRNQKYCRQLTGDLWKLLPEERSAGKPFEDAHIHDLRSMIDDQLKFGGYGVKVSVQDLRGALLSVSHDQRFHPVQEFLDATEWDGVERLDTLFIDWLGVEDSEYHRQAARLFCIAAIARIFSPGHKFDYAPIIEGRQGMGKSSFIRALACDWFVELKCGFDDNKKIVETLSGRWIAELPELSQFRRADIEVIKAFFSASEDKVRLSYRHDEQEFKRQSVYMGSSNNKNYLRDPTGGRRFWPLETDNRQIDIRGFKKIVPQIWAEAYDAYLDLCEQAPRDSLPLFLHGEAANDEALVMQESRRSESEVDVWAGIIREWANTPVLQSDLDGDVVGFEREDGGDDPLVKREFICAIEAWVEALGGRRQEYGRSNSLRVAEAIRTLPEWQDVGMRRHGKKYGPQRCFKRVARRRSKRELLY